MTYVVGAKLSGMTAIIADTRITSRSEGNPSVTYGALKTGSFFPGCIYGAAGNHQSILELLRDVRSILEGNRALPQFWDLFTTRVRSYPFALQPFSLIVSTRHEGEPKLYLLDSQRRTLEPVDDLVSIGSGKPLLDEELKRAHCDILPPIAHSFEQRGAAADSWAYLHALWLTQCAQGEEVGRLERAGVGGLFRFTLQTSIGEMRQQPALYLICFKDEERKKNIA